jgi:non-ribosomal peptide synthetase component E (peptide arylation enzyme)
MNTIYSKIAAILAVIIGAMAIAAGGQVLLGKVQDYYVIDWVPVYNFAAGMISVFVTAILIWKNHKYASPAAIITLFAHGLVMVILQTAYKDVVAIDSIVAMTVRITAWLIILGLLWFQKRKRNVLALG